MKNLFDTSRPKPEKEFMEILFQNKNTRVEHIISEEYSSPAGFWYDQDEDEWICILRGNASLLFEDGCTEMKAGDHMQIPAGKKHRVESTSKDCHWLAVFARRQA